MPIIVTTSLLGFNPRTLVTSPRLAHGEMLELGINRRTSRSLLQAATRTGMAERTLPSGMVVRVEVQA